MRKIELKPCPFCGSQVSIDDMPAADAAPVVHGRWRKSKEGVCGDYLFVCSACGADYWESPSFYKQAHYCPNCGAKMDEEVNE